MYEEKRPFTGPIFHCIKLFLTSLCCDTDEPDFPFQSRPLVPYEFSYAGMLDRVNSYIQNQDFCNTTSTWPDVKQMQPILANRGLSCTQQCKSLGGHLVILDQ